MATTQDSLGTNEASTTTPSELWQKADESLKIIEESLIAQGEPVENLSKSLPELYQKSQELQGNVNALSQRLESLEGCLIDLERNMKKGIVQNKALFLITVIFQVIISYIITVYVINITY